jgi:hypothetical protein
MINKKPIVKFALSQSYTNKQNGFRLLYIACKIISADRQISSQTEKITAIIYVKAFDINLSIAKFGAAV